MESKKMQMCGHNLSVLQLDKDNVRRCICAIDDEYNLAYLISYYTVVAVYDMKTATIYRTWNGWTRTTARHVSLFAKFMHNDSAANFTYFDWKCAQNIDGAQILPLDWLVRDARIKIPCNDKYVKWGW